MRSKKRAVHHLRGRIVREREDQHLRLRPGALDRQSRGSAIRSVSGVSGTWRRSPPAMITEYWWIGYAGSGTQHDVARADRHQHEVREALLGADHRDRLAVGVERRRRGGAGTTRRSRRAGSGCRATPSSGGCAGCARPRRSSPRRAAVSACRGCPCRGRSRRRRRGAPTSSGRSPRRARRAAAASACRSGGGKVRSCAAPMRRPGRPAGPASAQRCRQGPIASCALPPPAESREIIGLFRPRQARAGAVSHALLAAHPTRSRRALAPARGPKLGKSWRAERAASAEGARSAAQPRGAPQARNGITSSATTLTA